MGQICSRRQKLDKAASPDVAAGELELMAPTASTPDRVEKEYVAYLRANKVFVKDEEEVWSCFSDTTCTVNCLMGAGDDFASAVTELLTDWTSIDLHEFQLPLHVELVKHVSWLPPPGSKPRPALVGWYLKQAAGWLTPDAPLVSCNQAKLLLVMAIRLLLGKQAKRELPTDLDPSGLSDSVAVLLLAYRVIEAIGVEFLNCNSATRFVAIAFDSFAIDEAGNKCHCISELRRDRSELLEQIEQEFPNISGMALLRDIALTDLDDAIVEYFAKSLRHQDVSRKGRQRHLVAWDRAAAGLRTVGTSSAIARFVSILWEECPDLNLALLSTMEGLLGSVGADEMDKIEGEVELARILLREFGITSLRSTEVRYDQSFERKELLITRAVDSAICKCLVDDRLFRDITSSTQKLTSLMGVSWTVTGELLLKNLIPVWKRGEILISDHFFTIIKSLALAVSNDQVRRVVRELLVCSDVETRDDFQELITTVNAEKCVDSELKILEIRSAVNELLLVSLTRPEAAGPNLIGMLQSTLGDRDRKRRAELAAMAIYSAEFLRLNNFISLENLVANDIASIFKQIFSFNPYALLATSKVRRLCELLGIRDTVDSPEYGLVLHLAAIAYVQAGERDGAISLLGRLTAEFHYAESWRVALAIHACPPHLMTAAIALCPSEHLEPLLVATGGETKKRVMGQITTKSASEYTRTFPNLSDAKAVDKYVESLGGDETAISFEQAELLARSNYPKPLLDSLRKFATIGCF